MVPCKTNIVFDLGFGLLALPRFKFERPAHSIKDANDDNDVLRSAQAVLYGQILSIHLIDYL